jgi:hypothetical protein
MKKICLFLLIIAATHASAQSKDYIISMEGLGSLKFGMSQQDLEKMLKLKIPLDNHLDTINDHFTDTAKLKYKNIPVQLEFDRNYYAPNVFHWRLVGIKASSPLCKTAGGIGIGSDQLKIITAYDDYAINIQAGYANYYETEKGKGKSTISISNDPGSRMIRLFLLNKKVVSFELTANFTYEDLGLDEE